MPKLKPGANSTNTKREVWYAIGAYDMACLLIADIVGVVTSLNDSTHKQGSKHYEDAAFDGRTKHLSSEHEQKVVTALQSLLFPQGFDVLLEGRDTTVEHLHGEFDPKPGRTFEKRTT